MPPALRPPADVIARIDRLELEARQLVEGYLAGRHRSPRHGFAVEFAQHRGYAPGDDPRHIDWKVFARTERYQVKQYEQETNLVAWLVADVSGSMAVGTHRRPDGTVVTKFAAAAAVAAALAYLVTRQGDAVGLAAVADRGTVPLKSSSVGGQFREVLRVLADGPTDRPARTGAALRELAGPLGRRAVVFILSDFLDDPDDLADGLRVLRSRRHDVTCFQVLDPAEVDFPFAHPTLFRGVEGLPEVATDPVSVRDHYLGELAKHQAAVAAVCRDRQVDLVTLRSDADVGRDLAGYLRRRTGR